MGFSLLGTVIDVLMLLPSIVFFTKFPPRNVPDGLREAPAVFTALERIGQAGCFGVLAFSHDYFRLDRLDIWAALILLCIIIYYGLWFRYVRDDQDFVSLWKPFLFIPIPLAVVPVCAFGFAALWGRSIWLGAAAMALAIGHLAVTWNSYQQLKRSHLPDREGSQYPFI